MEKHRKYALAAALCALAALALIYAFALRQARKEREGESPGMLMDLTADRIAGIRITDASGEVRASFVRENGAWREEGAAAAPDQTAVNKLAASLTGVRLIEVIGDVADPGEYGLAAPRGTIEITDTDGQVTKILIGDENEMTVSLYCALNGDTGTVYAVAASLTAETGPYLNGAS